MVTFSEPVQTGLYTWDITWTSDQTISSSNPYRVYIDGVKVSVQTANTFSLVVQPGVPAPILEVLDRVEAVPQPAFPGYLVLGWNTDPDAVAYKVAYLSAFSGWLEYATIEVDLNKDFQSYSTPLLDDETDASWRITPIDAAGNEGASAAVFSALIVRHPDVPNVSFTYDGSGPKTVTIDEAA